MTNLTATELETWIDEMFSRPVRRHTSSTAVDSSPDRMRPFVYNVIHLNILRAKDAPGVLEIERYWTRLKARTVLQLELYWHDISEKDRLDAIDTIIKAARKKTKIIRGKPIFKRGE